MPRASGRGSSWTIHGATACPVRSEPLDALRACPGLDPGDGLRGTGRRVRSEVSRGPPVLHRLADGVDSRRPERNNDKGLNVQLIPGLTFGPQGPLFRYNLYHSAK